MKFGVAIFPTDYSIGPHQVAKEAEDRGFESIFFPEHTHIPASRKTPWPGGAELPLEYSHSLDLFVALGAAAAATEKIMLGTGICLVIERDPITLANEVARSITYRAAARFSASAAAGTAKRWKTMGQASPSAGLSCVSASRP